MTLRCGAHSYLLRHWREYLASKWELRSTIYDYMTLCESNCIHTHTRTFITNITHWTQAYLWKWDGRWCLSCVYKRINITRHESNINFLLPANHFIKSEIVVHLRPFCFHNFGKNVCTSSIDKVCLFFLCLYVCEINNAATNRAHIYELTALKRRKSWRKITHTHQLQSEKSCACASILSWNESGFWCFGLDWIINYKRQ